MNFKDIVDNSVSDDAEFEDLEDFDYVEEFASDEDDLESDEDYEDYDDLDDLYVDDEDEEFVDDEEDYEDYDDFEEDDTLFEDAEEDVEARFICEDCGHKWVDVVSETDEENDSLDISCPICGSKNVSSET